MSIKKNNLYQLVDITQLQAGDVIISLYNPPTGTVVTPHNVILAGQLFYQFLMKGHMSDALKCHTSIATEVPGTVIEVLPGGPVFTQLDLENTKRKALIFRLNKNVKNAKNITQNALIIAKLFAGLNLSTKENIQRQKMGKSLAFSYAGQLAINSILPSKYISAKLKQTIANFKIKSTHVFCSHFIVRCYQIASSHTQQLQTILIQEDKNKVIQNLWYLMTNTEKQTYTGEVYQGLKAHEISPSVQFRHMINSPQWEAVGFYQHLKNTNRSYIPNGEEFYSISVSQSKWYYTYPFEFYTLAQEFNNYHAFLRLKRITLNFKSHRTKRLINIQSKVNTLLKGYYQKKKQTDLYKWRISTLEKLISLVDKELCSIN